MLDTALAKLVQALAHDSWVLVDTSADLAEESGVLNLLEQLDTYFFVIWLIQHSGLCHGLQKIEL